MKKLLAWLLKLIGGKSKKLPTQLPDANNTSNDAKCGCDLSKPLAVPLHLHGNEATVDNWLANGGAQECGGTGWPIDVRFRLERPNGNYWCYAPFMAAGLVQYKDGKLMAKCGPFEGQQYHPHYMSAHNQGTHMEGIKITPGEWYPRDGLTFVYFQCRSI